MGPLEGYREKAFRNTLKDWEVDCCQLTLSGTRRGRWTSDGRSRQTNALSDAQAWYSVLYLVCPSDRPFVGRCTHQRVAGSSAYLHAGIDYGVELGARQGVDLKMPGQISDSDVTSKARLGRSAAVLDFGLVRHRWPPPCQLLDECKSGRDWIHLTCAGRGDDAPNWALL